MSIQYKHTALMNRLKQGYDRLRGKNAGLPFTGYGLQAATGCDEARGGDEPAEGNDYVEFMLHLRIYAGRQPDL